MGKIEFKDRVVEYPNRYIIKRIPAQTEPLYTIDAAPGEVTERGEVTAAMLNQMSDDAAAAAESANAAAEKALAAETLANNAGASAQVAASAANEAADDIKKLIESGELQEKMQEITAEEIAAMFEEG